jgi:hypothetical protein
VAGGCKGKKVREGPQQFNNGVQQAIWEACPISKLGHNLEAKSSFSVSNCKPKQTHWQIGLDRVKRIKLLLYRKNG